jgi:hypothetical protein
MKKNITIIAASLLLGTQMVEGAARNPVLFPVNPVLANLRPDEWAEYHAMKERFAFVSKRQSKLSDFVRHFYEVRAFVLGEPGREDVRGLACGIFFVGQYIVVNNGRLKSLFNRSKSSVNGCFQSLGYLAVTWIPDIFPILDGLPFEEKRVWTMRQQQPIAEPNPAVDAVALGFVPQAVLPPPNPADDDGSIFDMNWPFDYNDTWQDDTWRD